MQTASCPSSQTACRRGGPYVSARRRDMGANRGAVDAVMAAVCHDLGQCDRHCLPDPGTAPSPEPPVDRIPVAVSGRNIAPGRAATKPPEYAVDDGSVPFRGRRPRPRFDASIGSKPLKTRHSASVRSPRPKPASKSSLESSTTNRVNQSVHAG